MTPKEKKELEEVTLIASGYEWECPKCKYLNIEIEANDQVKCTHCYKKFSTSLQHAEG